MVKYFIDPYKKYYDKLSTQTGIVNESTTLLDNVSSSAQTINTLKSQLSSSVWKELGQKELVTTSIPGLLGNIQALQDNINDSLVAACTIAINELLPAVTNLKTEDENYESIQQSLNNLAVVPRYDSYGNETQAYRNYIDDKNALESNLESSRKKCEEYKKSADVAVASVSALDGGLEEAQPVISASYESSPSSISIVPGQNDGNLITVNYNGKEFYVVNTKASVLDYSEHVQKNRMYQNAGALTNNCMIASQIYVRDLLRGTFTSRNDFINQKGSPATRIREKVISQDKNEVLAYVFKEVTEGHPVVLQVTQKRSSEGLRHLVTVVGFNKNVKNASELTEKDILVLDNMDGKVQTLADRNRTLYNQGGKGYQALGPTDEFLAKEVTTLSASYNA